MARAPGNAHHYITMGREKNDDLNACATLAVREMIDFLMTEKHLSREDAYMLASVAADLHNHRASRRQQRSAHDAPQIPFSSPAPSTRSKTHP